MNKNKISKDLLNDVSILNTSTFKDVFVFTENLLLLSTELAVSQCEFSCV